MNKPTSASAGSKQTGSGVWVARDSKTGRFVEIKTTNPRYSENVRKASAVEDSKKATRRPGRFKDVLFVGHEFFEPLSENEMSEFNGL